MCGMQQQTVLNLAAVCYHTASRKRPWRMGFQIQDIFMVRGFSYFNFALTVMLLCCCGFCFAGWPTTERNLQLSSGASWYSKWKLLNHLPAPPRAKHSSGNTYMASTHWRGSNAASAFGVLPHVKRYCIEEVRIARCTGKQERPYLQVT